MNSLNENQEKVFYLLEELIKYDLNKNKIEIDFNKNYLINYYNNKIN
jgi:hypothetical protein